MAEGTPPWRLPDSWVADYVRLEELIEDTLSEHDHVRRAHMFESATHSACELFKRLMKEPPFAAAMENIRDQDPAEIAAAIKELKAGDWGTVVDDLGELLGAAGLPRMHARRASLDGVTRLLTADPASLVGPEAVEMFDRFRNEVCLAETWLGSLNDATYRRKVAETALGGLGGGLLAVAGAAAVTAAAPVAIAGAAAVAVVSGAVAVYRVARRYKGP